MRHPEPVARPGPHRPKLLFDTVVQFLRAGSERGDRLVVIAHPDHCKAIVAHVGQDVQVLCLDANAMLERFMLAGMPDADRFHEAFAYTLAELGGESASPRIGVYGEMADVLWRQGNFKAAVALEELCDAASARHSVKVLHAYLIGHFYKEECCDDVEAVPERPSASRREGRARAAGRQNVNDIAGGMSAIG